MAARDLIGKRSDEVSFWASPMERDRIWIDFPRPGLTREVAVDRKTYKPVLLRTLARGKRVGPDEQIILAETLPLGAGNFKAPRRDIVRRH